MWIHDVFSMKMRSSKFASTSPGCVDHHLFCSAYDLNKTELIVDGVKMPETSGPEVFRV